MMTRAIKALSILVLLSTISSCSKKIEHTFSEAQATGGNYDTFIDVVAPYESAFYSKNTVSRPEGINGEKVVVAVIDTGVDIEHKDLRTHIWVNQKEIANNGIDDDGNGYVDDVNGWNFDANSNELTDNMGHGTHISGIITAINANVLIMALKYYDSDSSDGRSCFRNSLEAIRYAIDNGAKIINYSGGGRGSSSAELELIKEAESKGVIFVASAGNEGEDSGTHPFYPASYGLSNIISVAATNSNDSLARYSNFGENVDIAAPGQDVYSTIPGNKYGQLSGTSQSAAFVSGAISIIVSMEPQVTTSEIKEILSSSSKHITKLEGKVRSAGMLDLTNTVSSLLK